jgi:hypothetical protein
LQDAQKPRLMLEKAVLSGNNPQEAGVQANKVLFESLYFSKYDTVKNIFWNEFSKEIPEEEAGIWAMLLPPNMKKFLPNIRYPTILHTSRNTIYSTPN